ncbi:MAG: hypothetical protein IID46_03425 [Planctomycetes bacterium]|nr:hypothetical protein [Planctomycetota bacterium]
MSSTYPPDIQAFLKHELASGDFQDETELLTQALKVYRELKTRHTTLRDEIAESIAAADRGEVVPLDIESIKTELSAELDESGEPK